MSRTVALALGLSISLAMNAYLLLTRPRNTQPPHPPGSSGSEPGSRTPLSARPPLNGSVPERASSDLTSSIYARLDRVALEKRLADAEGKLDELLPPEERFKLADRSVEAEERVRPVLDRIFPTRPGEPARYELECRRDVCHLTTTVDPSEWMDPLQTDPDHAGTFKKMMFGPDGAYLQLEDPDRTAGIQLAVKLRGALAESAAIRDCKRNNPSPTGTLGLTISFDASARRLQLEIAGDLAPRAFGICVRRAVEDLLASFAVPPDVTTMRDLPVSLTVP